MGKIYGSCGHEVEWDTAPVYWIEYTKEGEEALAYGLLCDVCKKDYHIVVEYKFKVN